jgi:isoleucyl-tRNA synthetase
MQSVNACYPLQEPPYGADVLRLWVSSVDATTGDVGIGPTILAQVG